MKKITFLTMFLTVVLLQSNFAQTKSNVQDHPDYASVKSAILDYVDGLYEADSTKIERSVHPELHKRGYWFNAEEKAYRDNLDMTYEQLVNLAARWNVSGKSANADSPKVIEIYDINDRTASAKLIAEWGMDYFHLAKFEGKWMIMNVLWQSLPKEK
ncbi:MAG: nuclear transport factor 2 family protein [Saprospiraceae bacterium]|jgi:hypothetical protein|nr:nuclear transport factor 2 family protein [Saprospiraceae bacterium]